MALAVRSSVISIPENRIIFLKADKHIDLSISSFMAAISFYADYSYLPDWGL